MEEFIADILPVLLGALFGSGGVVAYIKHKDTKAAEYRREDRQHRLDQVSANEQSVLSFYAMWNEELGRLRSEIDKLHALVGALENEVITLGGDPVRVRLELAKAMDERYDN